MACRVACKGLVQVHETWPVSLYKFIEEDVYLVSFHAVKGKRDKLMLIFVVKESVHRNLSKCLFSITINMRV